MKREQWSCLGLIYTSFLVGFDTYIMYYIQFSSTLMLNCFVYTCTVYQDKTSMLELHVNCTIFRPIFFLFCLPSDATLTTHNVVEMMKGIGGKYDNDLYRVLSVTHDKWNEISSQYQSQQQAHEALIAHAISTHPCLSWKRIACRLQRDGLYAAAAEVTRKYVKG